MNTASGNVGGAARTPPHHARGGRAGESPLSCALPVLFNSESGKPRALRLDAVRAGLIAAYSGDSQERLATYSPTIGGTVGRDRHMPSMVGTDGPADTTTNGSATAPVVTHASVCRVSSSVRHRGETWNAVAENAKTDPLWVAEGTQQATEPTVYEGQVQPVVLGSRRTGPHGFKHGTRHVAADTTRAVVETSLHCARPLLCSGRQAAGRFLCGGG